MTAAPVEPIEVLLGGYRPDDPHLFGPLPGRRLGEVIAYESAAPADYETWPGRSRVERRYALLDLGVSFGRPCWHRRTRRDGTTVAIPDEQQEMWYVDLVTIDRDEQGRYVIRDLFVDVMIGPGRQPRMLDLDDIADAYEAGWISTALVVDGLRRWQRFLDRHVHTSRFPQTAPTDFPPAAIAPLAALPGVLGPPVTWPG